MQLPSIFRGKWWKIGWATLAVLAVGLLMPQRFAMPVSGAGRTDYNPASFWYFPWGRSVTHKGVDIFAKAGTPVVAATPGFVLYAGKLGLGGNVLLVLGPKWRLHYYAHLQDTNTSAWAWVKKGAQIGTVGTTGNATGKPPHLHYAIATLIPYPWRKDSSPQGWKKMFYLDPTPLLDKAAP